MLAPPPIAEVDWFADMFRGGAGEVAALALLLAEMCERRRVPFLDAGEVAEASTVDGIHLDAEAHKALGLAVAKAVQGVFKVSAK